MRGKRTRFMCDTELLRRLEPKIAFNRTNIDLCIFSAHAVDDSISRIHYFSIPLSDLYILTR